jgi:hypothetical protein
LVFLIDLSAAFSTVASGASGRRLIWQNPRRDLCAGALWYLRVRGTIETSRAIG